MNTAQAFNNGFVKRAMEYGLNPKEAVELFAAPAQAQGYKPHFAGAAPVHGFGPGVAGTAPAPDSRPNFAGTAPAPGSKPNFTGMAMAIPTQGSRPNFAGAAPHRISPQERKIINRAMTPDITPQVHQNTNSAPVNPAVVPAAPVPQPPRSTEIAPKQDYGSADHQPEFSKKVLSLIMAAANKRGSGALTDPKFLESVEKALGNTMDNSGNFGQTPDTSPIR